MAESEPDTKTKAAKWWEAWDALHFSVVGNGGTGSIKLGSEWYQRKKQRQSEGEARAAQVSKVRWEGSSPGPECTKEFCACESVRVGAVCLTLRRLRRRCSGGGVELGTKGQQELQERGEGGRRRAEEEQCSAVQ